MYLRPPLLQASRTAIVAGKHELRVLDSGRAPPSLAYKTDSRRPCLTPKLHRPSSLPPEPPTTTARAISVAGSPPPSISRDKPPQPEVRTGTSRPRPPLFVPPTPGRRHAWDGHRPPPAGHPCAPLLYFYSVSRGRKRATLPITPSSFLSAPEVPPPLCFRFLPKTPCPFFSVTRSPLFSLRTFSPVAPKVLSSLQIGP
jgi:hypothetical protein